MVFVRNLTFTFLYLNVFSELEKLKVSEEINANIIWLRDL